MLVLVLGPAATLLCGCAPGYSPARAPEPDIDAILAGRRDYAELRIIHEPDAGRSLSTTVSAGTITMEYLVDDQMVGSHSVHLGFDEIINVIGGDHQIVIQQCYRGLVTLGGRSCQFIKYHFRLLPGERGRVDVVQPNVLRPKTAGFLQWHELDASRY